MAQNIIANTATSTQKVNVTSPAGGGGELLIASRPTTQITIVNVSAAAGLEYKLGAGEWKYLSKGIGAVLDVDISKVKLLFRLVNDSSASAQVEASLVSLSNTTPLSVASQVSPGNRFVVVGDSNSDQNFSLSYITAASRINNVVTITLSTPPSFLFQGCPIKVVGLPEDMCGAQTILSGSSVTWSYTNAGPDIPVVTLGSNPSLANLSSYNDTGWFVWMNILGMQRMEFAGMSAATGRATDEMLLRVHEVASIDAPYAYVMGGTNDVVGGRTVAQITANLQGIYECLLASGKRVYAMTIMPLGASKWTAPMAATIMQVNAWIKVYCRKTNGMHLYDVYGVMVDPLASNKGQAATGMINTSDGLHATQRGAYTAGKLGASLTSSIPANDFRTTSNADNYGTNTSSDNVQDNAPWATGGTVNTGTGTIGAGFTGFQVGTGSVLFSAPARSDGFGLDNKAEITATAANDGARFQGSSLVAARIPAGATVQLDVSVSVTGVAAGKFKSFQHFLSMTIASQSALISGLFNVGNTGTDCVQEDWSGIIRTPAVKLPIAPAAGSFTRTDITAYGASTGMVATAGRGAIRVTT